MIMTFGDTHGIFKDEAAFDAALGFLSKNRRKLDAVVLIGDMVDFYPVSRWLKDPSRKMDLQEELDFGKKDMARIRKAAGRLPVYYLEGNHEERMKKYLWKTAPELATLRELTVPNLLGLNKYKINWFPAQGLRNKKGRIIKKDLQFGNLFFTHGDQVQAHTKAFASKLYEKFGVSVIAGHSHRPDAYFKRDRRDIGGAWSIPCLCDLNPEYVKGVANWCHGFALVHDVEKEYQRFHVEPILIFDGKVNR